MKIIPSRLDGLRYRIFLSERNSLSATSVAQLGSVCSLDSQYTNVLHSLHIYIGVGVCFGFTQKVNFGSEFKLILKQKRQHGTYALRYKLKANTYFRKNTYTCSKPNYLQGVTAATCLTEDLRSVSTEENDLYFNCPIFFHSGCPFFV